MRARNIIFLILLCIELIFILYLAIKKSNHCLPGYLALGTTAILLILSVWLMLFPRYEDIKPTGNYTINYIEDYYTDNNRIEEFKTDGSFRELEVGIWYPENKDSCPLVVFSHGSFGTINNNKTLCTELASRGYIVVSISHTYHAFETTLADGTKIPMSSEFRQEILSDNYHKDIEGSYNHFKKWMKLRTDDISFVIDTIKEKSNNKENIYKNIDTSTIITMGHSLGGSAALGMPRLRNDITLAIALESPFMCDINGFNKENNTFTFITDDYPVPVLNIYSDTSYSHLNEWSQYQENYKLLNSNNPKYKNVYLEKMGHMHLCDFALQSPFLSMCLSSTDTNYTAKECLSMVNKAVLDFLKDSELYI